MVYFLDSMATIENKTEIPSYLHMMKHVFRSKIPEETVKSISNTDTVLTISSHHHIHCLEGISCKRTREEIASTQHYRKDCASNMLSKVQCDNIKATTIQDTRVWRHLETVIKNTNIALQNIIFNNYPYSIFEFLAAKMQLNHQQVLMSVCPSV